MSFVPSPIAGVLLAIPLLAACATASDTGEPEARGVALLADDVRLGEEIDRACFARQIRSFNSNERRTVVLEASVNRHFLVETFGACPNLRHAQSIAIDSTLSCITPGDALIVSESAFGLKGGGGLGPQRCTIKSIWEWDEDAEAPEKPQVEANTDAPTET